MESEIANSPDKPQRMLFPWWPIPFGFLAYFLLFYHFTRSGLTLFAMAFGLIGVPVLACASVCSAVVLIRVALGRYKNHLSLLGLLAWLCVAAICVAMAVIALGESH